MDADWKKEIEEVQRIIGLQADYLPQDAILNLRDKELKGFLGKLSPEEKGQFFESLRRFRYYTCLIKEILEERLASNFLLLILIALIEFVMGKDSYVPLPNFIDEKLKACNECDKDIVQSWLDDWRERYGSVNNIQKFFQEHLKDYKTELLGYVRKCEGWTTCTFPDVF